MAFFSSDHSRSESESKSFRYNQSGVRMPDKSDSKRLVVMTTDGSTSGSTSKDKNQSNSDQHQSLQVKFSLLPNTLDAQFQKDFPSYTDGLVRSSPGRYVTLPEYPKKAEAVYNLKPRPDDVYILTFPKCGSTCFLLYLIDSRHVLLNEI